MSDWAEVVVLVEGATEQQFIKQLLAPFLWEESVSLVPVILSKPGEKGGDVKFARARNDIKRHLKQRRDTYVTLMVDFYGIRGDWPGYKESRQHPNHSQKARIMNQATAEEVKRFFPDQDSTKRFFPYVSMHEIEALYFSDPGCLAENIGVSQRAIDAILREFGEPEKINDDSMAAPSKRLERLSERFKKTSTGIAIAREIGIPKMREACPIFNDWVVTLEGLEPIG